MAFPTADPTTIFQDLFTEASSDTNLTSHTPNVGTGWSLVYRDASEVINAVAASDTALPGSTYANAGIILSADATYPNANYQVSVKIVAGFTGTNRGYIIVRMQDQENMYALRFSTGASATRMYKKVSGTWTALGSFKADPVVGDTITLKVYGSVLQYFYNGILIDTQTDTAITSAGKAGLAMGGGAELAASTDDILSTNELDNFLVDTVEQAETVFATSVTSHPVYLPPDIASGELLIAEGGFRNAGTWTPPSGWTLLNEQAGGGSVGETGVWYRIADGTEGATATWATDVATTGAWIVQRVKNWHGTTPPEYASTNGDSASVDPPSLTPSWGAADTLWLAIGGSSAQGMNFTGAPTSYGGLKSVTAATGGGAANAGIAYRQNNTATENPAAFTTSTNRWWSTFTVAIRPAAGGTLYERTLDASASHSSTITKVAVRYKTLSATVSAVVSIALLRLYYRTLSANSVVSASLSRIATRFISLNATGTGTGSLTRLVQYFRSLSASSAHSASLDATQINGRTLDASATGVPTLSKMLSIFKTLSAGATGTPVLSRIATLYRSLTAGATGSPTLTPAAIFYRTLSATGTGIASLARQLLLYRTLSASTAPSATLYTVSGITQSLDATATGVASMARLFTYARTLSASAVSAPTISKLANFYRTLSATATASPTLTFTKSLFKSITATSISNPSITYQLSYYRTLDAAAVSAPTIATTVYRNIQLSAVATAIASMSIVRIFAVVLTASATAISEITTLLIGSVVDRAVVIVSTMLRNAIKVIMRKDTFTVTISEDTTPEYKIDVTMKGEKVDD